MSTFEADGIQFKKSSWSDTDWTKQCLGVHTGEVRGEHRFLLADSVTRDVLGHFPVRELAGLLSVIK